MLRQRSHLAVGIICVALVACDAGGSSEPATIPPTSPAPSALPTTATVASTTSDPTTSAVATIPAATLPTGVTGLSPGGPWTLVDSAPGITTPGLVYELMPKLWVYLPVEEDIPNGITWTLNEEDRPIIEAYLQARLVYYRAITARPMDLESGDWSKYYADGGRDFLARLEQRRKQGQAADLDVGVVLRPQVVGDGRTDTEAIVFDCVLDGGVFRLENGSLAPGSTLGVAGHGVGFRLRASDAVWVVVQVGDQPNACP